MNNNQIIRNEIGSEFWDVPMGQEDNHIFNDDVKYFISGTAALEFILKDIKQNNCFKSVALPSWCCESMIVPFINQGFKVHFYPVYMNAEGVLVSDFRMIEECDISLLIEYFGYSKQKVLGNPKGIKIRDITHSIFNHNFNDSDYYFGSLRKWAGIVTGGYAYKNNAWNSVTEIDVNEAYIQKRQLAMLHKKQYLYGETNQKDYLKEFEECEDYLDHCGVFASSTEENKKYKFMDVKSIQLKRRKNASILLESLKDYAIFKELEKEDCPLFVPIMIEERDALKKHLIQHEIYCPNHWPISEFHDLNEQTKKLYEHELSIVCDQRYDEEDMQRIVDCILEFLQKEDC